MNKNSIKMNKLIGFLLLMSILSCKTEKKDETLFNLIDVSWNDGWSNFYSMKFYNDGQTYIYNKRPLKGESYLKVNIGSTELDSLSGFVKDILDHKFDTLYQYGCPDCGAYNLIIRTNDTVFKSFVFESFYNSELKPMGNLISYCFEIGETSMAMTDTVFKFESQNYMLFLSPPPPPPLDEDGEY